jgi:hypothetical protein
MQIDTYDRLQERTLGIMKLAIKWIPKVAILVDYSSGPNEPVLVYIVHIEYSRGQ